MFLGWVIKGNGDITFYAPIDVEVTRENLINVQRLSGV